MPRPIAAWWSVAVLAALLLLGGTIALGLHPERIVGVGPDRLPGELRANAYPLVDHPGGPVVGYIDFRSAFDPNAAPGDAAQDGHFFTDIYDPHGYLVRTIDRPLANWEVLVSIGLTAILPSGTELQLEKGWDEIRAALGR